jgi:hypothetical protein
MSTDIQEIPMDTYTHYVIQDSTEDYKVDELAGFTVFCKCDKTNDHTTTTDDHTTTTVDHASTTDDLVSTTDDLVSTTDDHTTTTDDLVSTTDDHTTTTDDLVSTTDDLVSTTDGHTTTTDGHTTTTDGHTTTTDGHTTTTDDHTTTTDDLVSTTDDHTTTTHDLTTTTTDDRATTTTDDLVSTTDDRLNVNTIEYVGHADTSSESESDSDDFLEQMFLVSIDNQAKFVFKSKNLAMKFMEIKAFEIADTCYNEDDSIESVFVSDDQNGYVVSAYYKFMIMQYERNLHSLSLSTVRKIEVN